VFLNGSNAANLNANLNAEVKLCYGLSAASQIEYSYNGESYY
jgi:hypothetical protein